MIKKTIVILLCGMASTLSMDSDKRLEFMRNGAALSATMTQEQRIEFMRNGRQISQQLSQQVIVKEVPQEKKPVEAEKRSDQTQDLGAQHVLDHDVNLTEDDIINHVLKLSLSDNQPATSEFTQRIDNGSGKNTIVNYNVTINQKLDGSSQNINIGKKNNNF